MNHRTLWIVTPVFYDAESLEILISNIRKKFESRSELKLRFVAIDDTGGMDPAIRSVPLGPDDQLLTPPFNLGHQRAIVFGLRALKEQVQPRDLVVTMDSDGEDPPKRIHELLRVLEEDSNPLRVVLARRTKRNESVVFKFMYSMFKILFKALTGTIIKTGNFACFYGQFLRAVSDHPYFDLCYSSTFISLRVPVRYVPVAREKRYAGKSKMNFGRLVMHGFRMMMPFLDQIATRSLIFFGVTLGVGLVLSAYTMILFFGYGIMSQWGFFFSLITLCLSFVALGNFVILFSVFSQSQGVAMSYLDKGK